MKNYLAFLSENVSTANVDMSSKALTPPLKRKSVLDTPKKPKTKKKRTKK